MKLKELNSRVGIGCDEKLTNIFVQFETLIQELGKKDLPEEIINSINYQIEQINALDDSCKQLKKQIKKRQVVIIHLIEKKLKIVPQNYYRNMWLAIGIAVFGVPIGTLFGLSLDNMAFLGIGMPIGISIGIAIGYAMDKKAYDEGRQLEFSMKY